jgi:peptide/nickel transport system permease protein
MPLNAGSDLSRPSLLRRLTCSPLGLFGIAITLVLILTALSASLLAPYDPSKQSYREIFKPPSGNHWLGTDQFGRDVLSRLIYGSRISLVTGLTSVAVAVTFGSMIGLIAGYWRGLIDEIFMRLMDVLYSFPSLLLALTVAAVLGPGIGNVIVALSITWCPTFARLVRGQVLWVREMDYVTAARALGASSRRLIVRHIWPNVTSAIIVQATMSVSFAILVEASLSFLGIGVQPPTPSWGIMVRSGFDYLERAPWISGFSGLAIFLSVLGLNTFGDALREAMDPRTVYGGGDS